MRAKIESGPAVPKSYGGRMRKRALPFLSILCGIGCAIALGYLSEVLNPRSISSALVSDTKKPKSVSRGTSDFVDSRSWPKGTTREGEDSLWCSESSENDPRCLEARKSEVVRQGYSPWFTRSEAADNPAWTGLKIPSDWTQKAVRTASDADFERMEKANRDNEFRSDWTQYPYDVASYADGDGLFSNHENANDKATAQGDAVELQKGTDRHDTIALNAHTPCCP